MRQRCPIEGRVELRDVGFAYRSGRPVLRDVNLVVEPGQTVALVGPTGAGRPRSQSDCPFYDVSEGAVLIDGIDVRDVTQRSLRRQMGIVPQDPFLFSGTISDNIRFGILMPRMKQYVRRRVWLTPTSFIERLPDGYDTQIQGRGR